MDSFIFALNATLPIVIMIVIGYFIKKVGLMNGSVAKAVNKIAFNVLIPAMLFVNIYRIEDLGKISLNYVWYVLGITILLFFIFIPIVSKLFPIRNQRGVILQSIFRSNYALIGIPLATALYGAEGAAIAVPDKAITCRVISLSGQRTATVDKPPVVRFGTQSLAGSTIVSGPGQNFSASR